MSDRLPVGPYKMVSLADGTQAPWYLMPFDKRGVCEAPATRVYLVGDVQQTAYTDLFLFSHGWNDTWADANALYDGWLQGFIKLRRDFGLTLNRMFKPIFVGVIWPSIALVFPNERGPQFAGSLPPGPDPLIGQEREEIRALAEQVADKDRERFYALTQRQARLSPEEALELARYLAPVYQSETDEVNGAVPAPSAEELRQAWVQSASLLGGPPASGTDFGFARGPSGIAPQAAGLLDLDPRWIVRLATVYQMKDRAGAVGSRGVGPLLDALLAANPAMQVHLIGHSFGAKVLLSALCFQPKVRMVSSALLLQPAISYLCFAPDARGPNQPGGFVEAPNRLEQPILTTFSSADFPLSKVFHLAVRRSSDLGEQRIAAVPPSRYAALGGFGPAPGPGVTIVDRLKLPPDRYDLSPGSIRIIGINGSPGADGRGITGHGDASNPFTYWMLFNQVSEKKK